MGTTTGISKLQNWTLFHKNGKDYLLEIIGCQAVEERFANCWFFKILFLFFIVYIYCRELEPDKICLAQGKTW